MLLTTLLLALPLLQEAKNVSGGELRADQANWDVLSYGLVLKVVPEERWIKGQLNMQARALADLDRLALQLDGALQVTDVTGMLGNDEEWRPGRDATGADRKEGLLSLALDGEVTRIPAGAEFSIRVDYEGRPRVASNPPWKGGFTWSETADGRPWIATSCQGEGADLWWPCKDHPSDKPESMDLFITVPKGLFCASNGVLVSDETRFLSEGQVSDGSLTVSEQPWRTLHWRVSQPIANYAVALNIAPYEVLEQTFESVSGQSFPVFFWHLPESAEQAKAAFPEFLDHLRHLEAVCGPYPFRAEKYGIAETPHLGMEHQTVIAYGNQYRGGPDGFDWLHHHELAHEWWGNLVTCSDWKDMWLHEGFATYMQALYAEERDGPEGLQRFMRRNRRGLGNRKAVAPRETRDSQQIYFDQRGRSDSDIYFKGAWVLHTLRWHLGDEAFFELLRRFAYPTEERRLATDGSQGRFVDTEDFRRLAEEVHGADLGWFFEVYLRQPELPQLEARRDGDQLALAWIVPGGGPFPLDVPVEIDGTLVRVAVDEQSRGRVAAGPASRIDPTGWLLAK